MAQIISVETMDALKIMSMVEIVRVLSEGGVIPFLDCTKEQVDRALFFNEKDNNRLCDITWDVNSPDIVSYWDEEYFDKAHAYFDEDEDCFGACLVLKDVYGREMQFDVIKGEVYPSF